MGLLVKTPRDVLSPSPNGTCNRSCQRMSPDLASPQARTPAPLMLYTRPSSTKGLEVAGPSLFDCQMARGVSPAAGGSSAVSPFEGTYSIPADWATDGIVLAGSSNRQTS